jgi:chemotaxis protein MotA
MKKATTPIGIAVAFGGLALGALMEGSSLPAFFNVPALIIILGGTFGVTMAGTSLERIKAIPGLFKTAFSAERPDLRARIAVLVSLAERARRDGLLALDGSLGEVEDDFTRKGLQLVVDGTDPELVAEILETEIDAMGARHAAAAQPFEKAGGFAPTMGIIGTVMGLVHVLENLSAPETLGPAISGAFIATLYGVGSANVIFLPIANRLKALTAEEVELRTLTLEGILGIQAGENPRVLAEKLESYVAPAERGAADGGTASAAVPADAAVAPAAAGAV